MLLQKLLSHIIQNGTLYVSIGKRDRFQVGSGQLPEIGIAIKNHRIARRIALNPYLALGEAYMDGALIIEQGNLREFLKLLTSNLGHAHPPSFFTHHITRSFRMLTRRIAQYNPKRKARKNVAHHYDLSPELYRLFLDKGLNYSCAYFQSDDDSLEMAQEQKLAHIARKLCLKPGMRVLDIGCGWGGMAQYLAQHFDVHVTGITLSIQQAKYAAQRIKSAGLQKASRIELADYRNIKEQFDRIVSIGMFEHVGVGHYHNFLQTLKARLRPKGVALIHHIARADGPGTTNPWIAKYIFPGGYSPALSEILPTIEQSGFYLTDLEVWRLHYARTLVHWQTRFEQSRERIKALYDERFCRMWEFYLIGSEMAFRYGGHVVAQWQIAKDQNALPLTRDYMMPIANKRHIAMPA